MARKRYTAEEIVAKLRQVDLPPFEVDPPEVLFSGVELRCGPTTRTDPRSARIVNGCGTALAPRLFL